MGLSSEEAKIMWAKRRIKAGKPKEGDFKIVGKTENKTVKSEKIVNETEYENIKNSENYFDNSLDGFIKDTNTHTENPENDFFQTEKDANKQENENNFNQIEVDKKEYFKIRGATLLFFIDLIIPFGVVLLVNKFYKKGNKITASDVKMTAEEKNELEQLADEVAEEIGIENVSPTTQLIISILVIYGSKVVAIKTLSDI